MDTQTTQAWLKNFQQDLIENTNMETSQASPIYYGILDTEEQVVPNGYEDRIRFYDMDNLETIDLQEYFDELDTVIKKMIADNIDSGVIEESANNFIIDDESAFAKFITNNSDRNFECVYVADVETIAKNCMFLTRKDAEAYLHDNQHHHSKKAITYAMTAWRSPRVKQLLNILQNIDWDKTQLVLRNTQN